MAKSKRNGTPSLKALLGGVHARINYALAMRLLLGLSLALLAAMTAQIGWERLANRPEFLVYPSTFQLKTPEWATPRLSEELRNVEGLAKCYSIFEFDLTRKIAQAYERCPWVYKVVSIRREFPNRIKMQLILRKPAAMVELKRKLYLTDEDAVRLPREFYIWPDPKFDVPRIVRRGLKELPQPGKKWRDMGVRAAAHLAKFLADRKMLRRFQITTIDASNVGRPNGRRDSELVLWTAQHTRILWGSSPLSHAPGELSDEQKLANLLAVGEAEKYDFRRLEEVDVRWDRPYGKSRFVADAR